MPRRSTTIIIRNNTDTDLDLFSADDPCHGVWTNDIGPPSLIRKRSIGSWEAESSGIGSGTEGWVEYQITPSLEECKPELVYIYWDNPFIWNGDTNPIHHSVTVTDVSPPCNREKGHWFASPQPELNPKQCEKHDTFGISYSGPKGDSGITWWDVAVNWPALLGLTVLGELDINLVFTLGVRLKGSIRQTVGTLNIRASSQAKGQPSLPRIERIVASAGLDARASLQSLASIAFALRTASLAMEPRASFRSA